jgi:hypothetical protein
VVDLLNATILHRGLDAGIARRDTNDRGGFAVPTLDVPSTPRVAQV